MRYSIINNQYDESLKIKKQILEMINQDKDIFDDINPEYVFVIGGDGTFLKAVNKFNSILDTAIFVPIKFGGVGFYTNHNTTGDFEAAIKCGMTNCKSIIELSVIDASDGTNNFYSINEFKITNNTHPMWATIKVNGELLEKFRGTGLVFATPSGSTGFMRSAGGAIIYPDLDLFEMQELFAVSTNKFRTLNSPIIFSNKQKIEIEIEQMEDVNIAADTFNKIMVGNKLTIKLSSKKVKLLSLNKERKTKTSILKDIFVLEDETKSF